MRMIKFILLFLFLSGPVAASSGADFYNTTWLFVAMFVVAKGMGVLCEKIHIPSLVGEIGGGIILGNLMLFGLPYDLSGTVLNSLFFQYASELGVVFLLFLVGLESNLSDLIKVGFNSFITAIIGVVLPTATGFLVAEALGLGTTLESMLVGATFAATSVGITAKMLSEVGKIKTPSAQVILGAAVIDDVMGLIILAVLGGIVTSGSFSWGELTGISVKTIVFFSAAIAFGQYIMPQTFRLYKIIDQPGILTVLAVTIALVFSNLASIAGLAPIVGAFTAGLLLDDVKLRHAESLKTHDFAEVMKPITDFFLPLFFVSIGIQIQLATLADYKNVMLILILTAVAFAGKSLCGMACRGKGLDKLGIGFGMIPRGEVGLIFATFGLTQKIVTPEVYSVLVFVVLATTVIGPIALKFRVAKF